MEHNIQKLSGEHTFGVLFLANFIISFHLFFVIYMNSSFIGTFVEKEFIGLIYIIGSILSIISLLFVSRLLSKFGNYKILFVATIIEFFLFLGMAYFKNPIFVIPIFIVFGFITPIILFNFDIFLESYTKKETVTGKIRGMFLTITNIALIIAPLIAGLILIDENYPKIYLISGMFLIPFIFLITKLKDFKDPEYHSPKILQTIKRIRENKDLYNIFAIQFSLRLFFSWMVIYMPIYLHEYIGFSWTQIGIMTAIMLLPFVLIEYPAGKIADKWLGEKELLIVGFIIALVFTSYISFLQVSNFIIWTSLLFTIRIGASLIEIMSEVYFFRHVDGDDNGIIGFFRITRPVAYAVGPAIASIALLLIDFRFIFTILGIILLGGLYFSVKLQDTK